MLLQNCVLYLHDKQGQRPPAPAWFDSARLCFTSPLYAECGASPSECLWLIPTWEAFESAS